MNCNSLSSLSVVLCRVIKTPRASELPKRCTANCPINPLCRIQRAGSQWVTAPNKIGGQGHRAATKVCRGILLQRENFVSPSSRARSVGTWHGLSRCQESLSYFSQSLFGGVRGNVPKFDFPEKVAPLHLSKFGNVQGKCFHICWSFCHFRSSTSPCPEGSFLAPEISRLFGDKVGASLVGRSAAGLQGGQDNQKSHTENNRHSTQTKRQTESRSDGGGAPRTGRGGQTVEISRRSTHAALRQGVVSWGHVKPTQRGKPKTTSARHSMVQRGGAPHRADFVAIQYDDEGKGQNSISRPVSNRQEVIQTGQTPRLLPKQPDIHWSAGGTNKIHTAGTHFQEWPVSPPSSWESKFFLARARCLSAGLRYLRLTRLPRHDRGPVPGGNRSAASCLCTVLRRALHHYATRSPSLMREQVSPLPESSCFWLPLEGIANVVGSSSQSGTVWQTSLGKGLGRLSVWPEAKEPATRQDSQVWKRFWGEAAAWPSWSPAPTSSSSVINGSNVIHLHDGGLRTTCNQHAWECIFP